MTQKNQAVLQFLTFALTKAAEEFAVRILLTARTSLLFINFHTWKCIICFQESKKAELSFLTVLTAQQMYGKSFR
jgi:hypothetical protein